MAEAILRLLAKAGRNIPTPFPPERQYIRPKHGDAALDAVKMGSDMRAIAADLARVANRELAKRGK